MFSAKLLLALGFVVVAVSAGPMGGQGAGPFGGQGGPFAELEKSLTEEQKQQIKAIFTDESSTKQQIQDNIQAFFEKIGGEALVSF